MRAIPGLAVGLLAAASLLAVLVWVATGGAAPSDVAHAAPALPAATPPHGLERRPRSPAFLRLPPEADLERDAWALQPAFPRLRFDYAVRLVHDPRGERFYLCEQDGRVWSFPDDPRTSSRTLVLDIGDRTLGVLDAGLLGFALHPDFGLSDAPGGRSLFVWYNATDAPRRRTDTPPTDPHVASHLRLSRFRTAGDPPRAVPGSEEVLIELTDTVSAIHNGGALLFGPDDGFLYLSVGDDGRRATPQRIDGSLYSGVLRIDVDRDPARSHPVRRQPRGGVTRGYSVPDDNPFVDPSGATLEEFWALGLRSPHDLCADPLTGELWITDIGGTSREELNLLVRGGNYQWKFAEGTLALEAPPAELVGTEQPPVLEYGRGSGDGCIIGGLVYRGGRYPELDGKYLFADFNSARVFALERGPDANRRVRLATVHGKSGYAGSVVSLAAGPDGAVYAVRTGRGMPLHELVRSRAGAPVLPPRLLSETGAFEVGAGGPPFAADRPLVPAPALVPYDVNAPLWSDGARKRRWIALPLDGRGPVRDDAERVGFARDGAWRFPAGTVLVKHFELALDERRPREHRRLETRLLAVTGPDEAYAVTYRWREDGTDAELVTANESVPLTRTRADGSTWTQRWEFPSPADCLRCHTRAAGRVLGVHTRQLNRVFRYPSGVADNQLRTWSRIGMFRDDLDPASIRGMPKLVALDDERADLASRARSYLDANCAFCHRPGGVRAGFDARHAVPLADQGLLDGPLLSTLRLEGARVVVPGDPAASMLYRRLVDESGTQMPPLARNVVHTRAAEVVRDWIAGLRSAD